MNRVFWGAVLIGELVLVCFQADWLLSLSQPWLAFAEVGADLLLVACLLGIILPERWAEGFQAVIAFIFLLFMLTYVPLCM